MVVFWADAARIFFGKLLYVFLRLVLVHNENNVFGFFEVFSKIVEVFPLNVVALRLHQREAEPFCRLDNRRGAVQAAASVLKECSFLRVGFFVKLLLPPKISGSKTSAPLRQKLTAAFMLLKHCYIQTKKLQNTDLDEQKNWKE